MKSRQDQWNSKRGGKASPSKMCISVNIGKGSGTLFCHVKVSLDAMRLNICFRSYYCVGFLWR